VTQKAAHATFSAESMRYIQAQIASYKNNAAVLKDFLCMYSERVSGAEHSPYVWFKCPFGMDSWEFFSFLLDRASLIGTPGVGFGDGGEGFFRFSSFCSEQDLHEAVRRMELIFKKGL
jgi:LL-diaminopimelate aminotransferase